MASALPDCRFVLALALLLGAAPAQSAIIGTCTIVIGPNGLMKNNATIDVLGSRQAGGSSATATVTADSLLCTILNLLDCYSVSTPAPASFLSAPSGGDTGVSFATVFKLNGGADQPGNTPVRVVNGTYNVAIDLTATRSSGVFPTGSYQAQVVLRCE